MSLIHLTAPTINVYICVITVSCLKSDLELFNVAWQGGVVLSFYFPVKQDDCACVEADVALTDVLNLG